MTNLDDQHQLADQILSDQSSALDLHNTARESQGLPPLQWDAGLSNAATRWAQHLAREGKFYHQKGSGTGENLVWISACFTPYQAAAQCWLDEVENYHDQRIGEGDFLSYGHYSESRQASTEVRWGFG